MNEQAAKAPMWKRIVAGILDFITVFFAGGYVIAYLFGGVTDGGFNLEGGPAILLFALIAAYFVVCIKYLGGTLWQRIFGIAG